MRLRLIGLGNAGEEIVAAVSQYCLERGIASFEKESGKQSIIESRTVIKLFTGPFSQTFLKLRLQARLESQPVKEQVQLRMALAYLFFGGPHAELDSRFEILTDYSSSLSSENQAKMGTASQAVKYFHDVLLQVGVDARVNVLEAIREGKRLHEEEIAKTLPTLGEDFLILPEIPLFPGPDADRFEVRTPNIGRELIDSILEDQAKRRRLIYGLGTEDSDVDVVIIAFSVGDAFGCEGATALCRAIRRTLQYPEANRIVAVLGFGLYGQAETDGRFVGDYMKGDRPRRGFDGLIVREASDCPGSGFPELAAAIGLSSDPNLMQLDNPDANQIQRDFGRSLVSAGYAEKDDSADDGANILVDLYSKARDDLFKKHSTVGPISLTGSLEEEYGKILGREDGNPAIARALQGDSSFYPILCKKMVDYVRGEIEGATARKVIAYIGHREALDSAGLRDIRAKLSEDFPRARTAIYKYSLPEPSSTTAEVGPEPALKGNDNLATRTVRFLVGTSNSENREAKKVTASAGINPQIALFVVSSFETQAVEKIWQFVERRFSVRVPDTDNKNHFANLRPGQNEKRAKELKARIMVRSLLSLPGDVHHLLPKDEGPWQVGISGDRVRTATQSTIIGGIDPQFAEDLEGDLKNLLATPAEFSGETVGAEAGIASLTVRKVRVFLENEAKDELRTSRWLADVLAGLNWLCTEEVEPRKVAGQIWMFIQRRDRQ